MRIGKDLFKKNKKGISIIIGYVLLISVAIVIGGVTYQWLKSYVPKDSVECPEGVSMYLEKAFCNNNQLKITLKNNGRFDIEGYFVHASNNSLQEIATIDLSKYLIGGAGTAGEMVKFS